MQITEFDSTSCHLGEGPLWDTSSQSLYWVDSLGPKLYRKGYPSGETQIWNLPGQTVGSLAVRASGGLILAMDQGLYAFDPRDGKLEMISEPLAGKPNLRFNDGKVDRFGAFVTGALNIDYRQSQNCAMYRLSAQLEVTELLDGFNCFNGPCFDETGTLLYLTGRQAGVIECFDYDPMASPDHGRVLLADCNPDGATVDAAGYVWSAQWDDACIIRISAVGEVVDRIDFPGQIVSSVMFGGPELNLIFVATVGAPVNGTAPTAERAGRVLVVEDSGYHGRAEPEFLG